MAIGFRASSAASSDSGVTAVSSQAHTLSSSAVPGDLILIAVAVAVTGGSSAAAVSLSGGSVPWISAGVFPFGGGTGFGTGITLAVFSATANSATPGAALTATVTTGSCRIVSAAWSGVAVFSPVDVFATAASAATGGVTVLSEPSGTTRAVVGGDWLVDVIALQALTTVSALSYPADAGTARASDAPTGLSLLALSDGNAAVPANTAVGGGSWSWTGASDSAGMLIALRAVSANVAGAAVPLAIPSDGGLAFVLGQHMVISPIFPLPSASGSGTVWVAEPSIAAQPSGTRLTATLAAAAGAALTPGTGLTATLAAAAGAALTPDADNQNTASFVTGTALAQSPDAGNQALAGLTAAAGAALTPNADNQNTASFVTGTALAQSPDAGNQILAGLATGAGFAQAPDADNQILTGSSSATGTVQAAGTGLALVFAAGTGLALSPDADNQGTAGLTAGSSLAQSPGADNRAAAGLAAGTGTNPGAAGAFSPGLATGTGSGQVPSSEMTVITWLAAGEAVTAASLTAMANAQAATALAAARNLGKQASVVIKGFSIAVPVGNAVSSQSGVTNAVSSQNGVTNAASSAGAVT